MRINKFNDRKVSFNQRYLIANYTTPWSVFSIAVITRLSNYKGETFDLIFWAATIPNMYLHYHTTFKQWGVEIYNLPQAMCSSTWKGKQCKVAEKWRVLSSRIAWSTFLFQELWDFNKTTIRKRRTSIYSVRGFSPCLLTRLHVDTRP